MGNVNRFYWDLKPVILFRAAKFDDWMNGNVKSIKQINLIIAISNKNKAGDLFRCVFYARAFLLAKVQINQTVKMEKRGRDAVPFGYYRKNWIISRD